MNGSPGKGDTNTTRYAAWAAAQDPGEGSGSSSSGGADDGMGKLGCILPTAKDKEDAAGIARYIRNEMSDDSVAGLLMKLQEWDQDGDRMLGLKEFYRALTASFEVPEAAAVTASAS